MLALDPETLIDWYFHAADMKTKLDRQSNDLSPKYIAAGKNDRPVMNFQSTQNTPVNNINHKLFKYDDLANEDVEASHHHQQQHQRRGRHQPGEQLSRINDSPWSTSPSGETDEPLVTDYGARRTNDASMWYLRRFKSSDDTPTDVQLKQQNQNERFSSSPTHHWPGSIDQTDSQYDMSGKKQDQYDGGQKKHRAHVNHQRYPSEGEYMQRQQQQSPQQEQQNYLGSPLGNEGAFHSRASSDHQYAKNNGNPSSIFKQASAVTTWEEQFPISDEFDSAFNSVVAGGDPIANNRIKSTDSHHQHSQAKKQQKSTQPIVDSFKYDYESASGPASSHNDDRPGPSSYAPQSKAGYSSRSPSVQPNMYEPVGYPRRFYRLKL